MGVPSFNAALWRNAVYFKPVLLIMWMTFGYQQVLSHRSSISFFLLLSLDFLSECSLSVCKWHLKHVGTCCNQCCVSALDYPVKVICRCWRGCGRSKISPQPPMTSLITQNYECCSLLHRNCILDMFHLLQSLTADWFCCHGWILWNPVRSFLEFFFFFFMHHKKCVFSCMELTIACKNVDFLGGNLHSYLTCWCHIDNNA